MVVTRFYEWLLAQLNSREFADLVRWVKQEDAQLFELKRTENLTRISSELFGRHAPVVMRKKMRQAHKEWRRSLLVEKFGEWPIRNGRGLGAQKFGARVSDARGTGGEVRADGEKDGDVVENSG